jgi:nicotinamide mononucleotide (NMN) deamidase PncC
VGTIWYGVALDGRIDSHRALLPGTRHDIRARAAQAALHLLLRRLRS